MNHNLQLGSIGDHRQQYCDIGGLELAFEVKIFFLSYTEAFKRAQISLHTQYKWYNLFPGIQGMEEPQQRRRNIIWASHHTQSIIFSFICTGKDLPFSSMTGVHKGNPWEWAELWQYPNIIMSKFTLIN